MNTLICALISMELLPPTMAIIERFVPQTPAEFKIAPNWEGKS